MRLERCGFMLLVATADGASPNRTFMRIHTEDDTFPYKVLNPFASTKRHIHFISDPPHLLKTARNCWSSNKRQLWVGPKCIYVCSIVHLNARYSTTCVYSAMGRRSSGSTSKTCITRIVGHGRVQGGCRWCPSSSMSMCTSPPSARRELIWQLRLVAA